MTPKPPQKEAQLLCKAFVEQNNKLKEFAKKQMVELMKKEHEEIREMCLRVIQSNNA